MAPFREKRKYYEANIPLVYQILEEGTARAREKARQTVSEVERALGVNYFSNKKLIEKQAKAYKKKLDQEAALQAYLAKQKKKQD